MTGKGSNVGSALLSCFREEVTEPDERTLRLIHELLSMSCCARCTLRLVGIRNIRLYRHPQQELMSGIVHVLSNLAKSSNIDRDVAVLKDIAFENRLGQCPLCLGCLSDSDMDEVLVKIVSLLEEADFDSSDYILAITVANNFTLRHATAVQYMRYKGLRLDADIPDVKGVAKWILAPLLEEKFERKYRFNFDSQLKIIITVDHEQSWSELEKPIAASHSSNARPEKRSKRKEQLISAARIQQLVETLIDTTKPPKPLEEKCTFTVDYERAPVYVAGRYRKLERGLSQSPWVVDGKRIGEESVEELIANVIAPSFRARSYKFHTAGREDIDVRMLGSGRPFVLEMIDPKRSNFATSFFEGWESEINELCADRVSVLNLKSASKDCFAALKDGADSKRKTYCCVVWVSKELTQEDFDKLESFTDLTIEQKTPVRVLHRRTLMTRPKIVHKMWCQGINSHFFQLHLTTSAGAYVKEFVHGDLMRTSPNIGELLGCDADILQLDVEDVHDDLPI